VTWALSGWETSAVTLCWLAALRPFLAGETAESRPLRASLVALAAADAAVALRPDSALLLALVSAQVLTAGGATSIARRSVVVAFGWIPPVAIVLWQHAYYGSWLPNTAVLKRAAEGLLSIPHGLAYVASSATTPLHLLVVAGVALLYLDARTSERPEARRRRDLTMFLQFAGLWLAYVVWVGGDAFGQARFFVPLLPPFVVLGTEGLAPRLERLWSNPAESGIRSRVGLAMGAGLVVSLLVSGTAKVAFVGVPGQKSTNRLHVIAALAVRNMKPGPDATIGVFAAGTVPYFNPGVRFHDMLGKNDVPIARTEAHSGRPGHNRWDFDYSLGKVRPDLIITTYPLPCDRPPLHNVGFNRSGTFYEQLFHHARFQNDYYSGRIPLAVGGEVITTFEAYGRRDSAFVRSLTMGREGPQSKASPRNCPESF
jgi:hypothetical protein